MTFRKIGFFPIANKPTAISSILFSSLKNEFARTGDDHLFEEVVSVSLSGADITVKTKGKMAASEFLLRSDRILEAFVASLSNVLPPAPYRLRIK